MTEGNMVQLRVLRSIAHKQDVYWSPESGVRVYSEDEAGFTLICSQNNFKNSHYIRYNKRSII